MFYIETTGSAYEMGVQAGRACALQIGSMLDYLTKGFRGWDEAKFNRVRAEHMACTERLCPELIEEVQGIADGSGSSFRLIYLMNFYTVMTEGNQQCTNVIFPQTPDGPLLGKTNDLPVHEGKHSGVRLFRPAKRRSFLGETFPGTVWCGCGVNDAGLAIGGSSCSANVPQPREVLAPHVVNRYVLERAATVKEAIALLATIPVPRWGTNIPLVDRTGAAAIVEKAGNVQGVRWSKGEPIFCTNFSCTTELAAHRLHNAKVLEESTDRFSAIERLIRDRETGRALLGEVLARTEQPGAISRYGDVDPLQYETEFAAIFSVAHGRAEFCFSHPDRDPWRTFQL